MEKIQIAAEKFMGGYNCAQSVIYAFCDDLNMNKHTALKLACGFGAGMARGKKKYAALSAAELWY